jgi:hypothetical protein
VPRLKIIGQCRRRGQPEQSSNSGREGYNETFSTIRAAIADLVEYREIMIDDARNRESQEADSEAERARIEADLGGSD